MFFRKGNDGLSVFTFRNRWVSLSPWSPWQTDCYQSSTWWSVIKVVMWNRRTKSCSNVSAAYLGEIIFEVVCSWWDFYSNGPEFHKIFLQDFKAQTVRHLILSLVKKSKQNKIRWQMASRILLFKICKFAMA